MPHKISKATFLSPVLNVALLTMLAVTAPSLADAQRRTIKEPAKAASGLIAPASKTLKRGLTAISKNDAGAALAARAKLRSGTLEHKILGWVIALYGKNVDVTTLSNIANSLGHWPGSASIRANIERALVKQNSNSALRTAFSASTPETVEATIALAKAHLAVGAKTSARKVLAPIWRRGALSASQEKFIAKSFGSVLTKQDHRARVEYLLTRDRLKAAARIAGLAGATRLVAARAAVHRKQRSAGQSLEAVPTFQRTDPNYLLSKARYLRRKERVTQASKVLISASPKEIPKNSADDFWIEQRILISDLMELGKNSLAYSLAKRNVARAKTKRLDAEFLAGWIALRKLNKATLAISHFSRLLEIAGTPLSKSRGHYWLGRALTKAGRNGQAGDHFVAAARYDTTYYGQLAAQKLGRRSISITKTHVTSADRVRFNKYELVQVISKLESAGHGRRARPFYSFLAHNFEKPGELALLAARAERQRDYQLSLQVGKRAFIRGFKAETLAWPIGAIPTNTKTSGAGLSLAYAIARQESAFRVDARSPANALGLLQLLPTTAKRTARSIGVKYSRSRLVNDASYNARLGGAYLSQQMKRFGGSFVLTFAAYNAGPLRAQQWMERFGDPRGKPINFVIDWIEQIPYSETRNYVQRVMENYQVYKTRLKGGKLTIERDLRAGRG